jgi:hypothetical protein
MRIWTMIFRSNQFLDVDKNLFTGKPEKGLASLSSSSIVRFMDAAVHQTTVERPSTSRRNNMSKFDTMGKVELRQACKEAGIKNYGKMNNDGMRAALKTHYADAKGTEEAAPEAVVTEEVQEEAPVSAPSGLVTMVQQIIGANQKKEEERSAPAAAKRTSSGLKIEKDREERNGVKRPSAGGACRAVWDALDAVVAEGKTPTAKDVKALAEANGWNPNNASIEFYQWRKFNGIRGRQ